MPATLTQALPYEEGMSFRQYLQLNAENIRKFEQHPFEWQNNLSDGSRRAIAEAKNNADFRNVLASVPTSLNRDIVSEEWKKENNLYGAFVSTLLWGGYHIPVFTRRRLPEVATLPRAEIDEKLLRVQTLLESNSITEAFESMINGNTNYIYGMSFSFFTKFLYFIGKDMTFTNDVKPLIFDNQSRKMHVCLLKSDGEDITKWYKKNLSGVRDRSETDLYIDYINRMKKCAEEIGTTGEQLEAFLFGKPLNERRGGEMTNPRAVINRIANETVA